MSYLFLSPIRVEKGQTTTRFCLGSHSALDKKITNNSKVPKVMVKKSSITILDLNTVEPRNKLSFIERKPCA